MRASADVDEADAEVKPARPLSLGQQDHARAARSRSRLDEPTQHPPAHAHSSQVRAHGKRLERPVRERLCPWWLEDLALCGSEGVHQRIETPERSQPKPEWDFEEAELDQRAERWRHVAALRKDHVPGHASVLIKPELGALAQESKANPIEKAQPVGPHSLVGHEVPPHRVVHIRLHEDLDNRVEVLWMLARRVQSRRDGVALDEGCSSRPRTRLLHRGDRAGGGRRTITGRLREKESSLGQY